MADEDVRNALARRLQRNHSDSSPTSKPGVSSSTAASSLRGLPPLPTPRVTVPTALDPVDSSGVRVEGYLYKYSSGRLARWQKRYFVLESGRLSYFKKQPSERDPLTSNPCKTFSIRRIKAVNTKQYGAVDDREFTLVFANGKSYQMRAPTHEDMRKWAASIRGAIAYFEAHGDTSGGNDHDGGMSDDGVDGMTSTGGSVISESSPRGPVSPSSNDHKLTAMLHGLIPRRESLSGALHLAVKPLLPSGPEAFSMLEVEIDPDQLDRNFEEWFYFVPLDESPRQSATVIHREMRMSNVVEACTKANNHLWSTLANLPRGADTKLEDAVVRAKARIAAPLAVQRATIVVEEYLTRVSKYVCRCLDVRSSNMMNPATLPSSQGKSTLGLGGDPSSHQPHHNTASELPQLMDCIARIVSLIDKILPSTITNVGDDASPSTSQTSTSGTTVTALKCVCCYCDPSGLAMLKLERQHGGKKNLQLPPVSCSVEKWRKALRLVLQRVGGELEVGLIEELQGLIQSAESAWEAAPRSSPNPGEVFGPCPQSHPLLDDMKLAKPAVLMSSFGPSFIQTAQTKCLNASSQWMAAYPLAARLVSEHTSSALVASLNSVWRQFKRAAATASERASVEVGKKYTESVRNSREGVDPGAAADFANLEHLISFANECVLVSRFCSKTWSNGVSAKFTPDVFLTCMEGLAAGFQTTAADVCHSVVKLHFFPRVKFDMNKMFNPKNLAHNHASPMTHAKLVVEQFIDSVVALSPLPCVMDGVVALLGAATMKAYASAFIRNKPKLKVFKTVPAMLKDDTEVFRSLFSVGKFAVAQTHLSSSIAVIGEILKILAESNKSNFSIHFNSISKLVGSKAEGFHVISNVAKMREHEWTTSADRKDVASMLASMKVLVASERKQSVDDDDDHHGETIQNERVEEGRKPSKNGPLAAVAVTLAVGELKDVPWRFGDL